MRRGEKVGLAAVAVMVVLASVNMGYILGNQPCPPCEHVVFQDPLQVLGYEDETVIYRIKDDENPPQPEVFNWKHEDDMGQLGCVGEWKPQQHLVITLDGAYGMWGMAFPDSTFPNRNKTR